jgi:nicotinamidase/pyrazinamidase
VKVALLVIDVQVDFCSGGALAASNTRSLIAPLNRVVGSCVAFGVPVAFTRDWHPKNHGSFVAQGGRWPPHCVQDTKGAAFATGLNVPRQSVLINKGTEIQDDGYSMFVGTELEDWLRTGTIGELAVCGIATEYCVLESTRDALMKGFQTVVLADLVRPIDEHPGDGAAALREMQHLGAAIRESLAWAQDRRIPLHC